MVSSKSIQKELESLRKEIAGLQQEYTRLKGGAKAVKSDGAERVNAIREELVDTIETIKSKIAGGAEAASDEIAERLSELRDVVDDYADKTEKTISAHPLASLAGALAVGYLIGRLGR